MRFLSVALPLAALASGAFANPLDRRGDCVNDACLAAVTGHAALGDGSLRASHCASFLATTVTPPAVTVTETITGAGSNDNWKRASVTVCPNEVPNYASACDEAAYTSACSCFGFTEIKTTTLAPTTTTKTVYVAPTGVCATVTTTATSVVVSGTTCPAASTVTKYGSGSGPGHSYGSGTTCPAASTSTITKYVSGSSYSYGTASTLTVTKYASGASAGAASTVTVTKFASGASAGAASTVTVTKFASGASSGVAAALTVTKTVSGSCAAAAATTGAAAASTTSAAPAACVVDDTLANTLVNNFIDLLEFTSYPGNATEGIPAGSGYNQSVSDATLDPDFVDISDSINFMAGFPLGSITFANKTAFDIGQGQEQPEVSVSTLNIWHDCNSITWRWRLFANPVALPVTGINHMIVGSNGLIVKNYAEFDNGAWLQSFGQNCAITPPSVAASPALKRRLVRH